MQTTINHRLAEAVAASEEQILDAWLHELEQVRARKAGIISEQELRSQGGDFLAAFTQAIRQGNLSEISSPAWSETLALLTRMSSERGQQGFTPSETATFIFSLKQPIFSLLRTAFSNPDEFAEASWTMTTLLDKLGLVTVEMYQKSREQVIRRQQQEILELSTPVIKLWDGILAVPLIGTLDSARTQVVMETLLQRIVETGSAIAIIDITGVPTVDTLVAQYLLKTVAAARLMGADCMISGIRPQIAQTIVHLGVTLNDVTTKASMADAFKLALVKTGARLESAR